MLDVGFSEILLTSAIALIVLGPERLPKVARQVGNWMGRARVMARQLTEQLEREVSAEELLQDPEQQPGANSRRDRHLRGRRAGRLRHQPTCRTTPLAGTKPCIGHGRAPPAGAPRTSSTRRKALRPPHGADWHASPPDNKRAMSEPGEPGGLAEGTLISHLLELRDRLLKAMLAVGICFVPCVFYMNQLFTFVANPLIRKLPAGADLIATGVVAPFTVPFKMALLLAIGCRHAFYSLSSLGIRRARPLQAREETRRAAAHLQHHPVLHGRGVSPTTRFSR